MNDIEIIFGDSGTGKSFLLDKYTEGLIKISSVFLLTEAINSKIKLPDQFVKLLKRSKLPIFYTYKDSYDNIIFFCDDSDVFLDSKLVKKFIKGVFTLARRGYKFYIVVTKLFTIREFYIQHVDNKNVSLVYTNCIEFGKFNSGYDLDFVGNISFLEEDLEQSYRYLDLENGFST